jgi:hypothetical protein
MDSIKYPIYIVSKGRWENPLTAKMFLKENIPFKIAVELQEYENYCNAIGKQFVLKLPFSNLGLGSYPARNHCWEDSLKNGHEKHWVFDDNIRSFDRWKNNKRISWHSSKEPISVLEKFNDSFLKVAISAFDYDGFVRKPTKPFTINCHCYSAMLINNEMPYRWRLKYNEDVDLCLQALHNGWNTILLQAFSINKVSTTAKMKGGNQTELYKGNATEKKVLKAKSLEMVWPQYVKTVMRFNRPHHFVDWKKHFTHPLLKISRTNENPSKSPNSFHR